jgi:hypothetical protein
MKLTSCRQVRNARCHTIRCVSFLLFDFFIVVLGVHCDTYQSS